MTETRAVDSNRVARPEPIALFSGGVRVLVIDDNAVCLQVLAFALRKCGYEVTATTKAAQALEMLRRNKDDYDIVITDVVRVDMDGFKLLEIIGLEMDIPVIMTSANGDETIQYKGLHHGARDYLVKPVRMEHLRNIWRHVDGKTAVDDLTAGPMRGGEAAANTLPQEKHHEEKSIDKEDEKSSQPNRENTARKKSRISWTRELHKKFVQAVQKLGVDEAVPKRILEAMNEPELTREHVASHLQKYRISLRKQKASMEQKYATTTTMSTVKHTPILDSSNRSTSCCKNLDTIFSNQSASPFLHPRQHHFSLQQNIAALKRGNPMPPTVPIPVFSNVIQGSFLPAEPHKFIAKMPPAIYSGRKMDGDYTEVSGRVPSFNLSQSSVGSISAVAGQDALSNHPLIYISPSSRSPHAFSAFGAPYPMYDNVVTQRTPVSKAEYPALHVPNSLTGLHEGRGLFTNGRTTGSAVHTRSQIDVTKGNDQMTLMELLLNDSENESNDLYNSRIFRW